MTAAVTVLEQLTRITPFGLGLWDVAAGALVSEGLSVRLRRFADAQVDAALDAHPNRAGIFIAEDLPALRAFEMGIEESWTPASPPQLFLVEVRDALGRFTPFVMTLSLPQRGLAVPHCVTFARLPELPAPPAASPPARLRYVPLFSAATRLPPAGMAVVRATLINVDSGVPAHHAVLEVHDGDDTLGRGIADEQGQVAVFFAYPEPEVPFGSSPPTSPPSLTTARALTDQEWTLAIKVRFGSNLTRYTLDRDRPAVADLCALLDQPEVDALTSASPPSVLSEVTLSYGEELLLGEEVVLGEGRAARELFIRPA